MPNISQWNKNNIFKFTVSNKDIEEDLTNFPLLLNIKENSGITGFDCSAIFDELDYPKPSNVTFSGINYSQPDTNLWTVSSKEKVYIYNNALTISGTSSEQVISNFTLSGNFDIQVDIDYTVNPSTNSWAGQLAIDWVSGTYTNSISIYKGYTDGALKCISNYNINGVAGVITNINNSTNPSKLRITRAASTAYFYFWENSAWISMGSYTTSTDDVKIKIINSKWDSTPSTVITFNNFIINEGTVVWPTAKHPNCKKIAVVYPATQTHYVQKYDNYTSLLIHSNDGTGSTNFIDDSIYKNNITRVGSTQHSNVQYTLDCISSIYFDGSGNYLSIPYSDLFNFGYKDFTIDLWVFIPTSSTFIDNEVPLIMGGKQDNSATGGGWNMHIFDKTIKSLRLERCFTNGISPSYEWTLPSFERDVWHHVAICRKNSTSYCFYDGVSVGSTEYFSNMDISINNNLEVLIGTGRSGISYTSWVLKGYLSEIRISKGIARWTQNFYIATTKYAKNSVFESYVHVDNEQLYCEIENWDQNNKSIQIWTKVPKLLCKQPTELLLYFDKNQPNNNVYIGTVGELPAQNVWDEYYVGVYHMNQSPEAGGKSILDSTSNKNNSASSTMSSSDLVVGKISKAINFSSDYISLGSLINTYTSVTHSAWFNSNAINSNRQYITTVQANPPVAASYTYQERQGIMIAGTTSPYNKFAAQYQISSNSPASMDGTTILQPNIWYHGAFTADSYGGKLYLNGSLEVTSANVPISSSNINQRILGARIDAQGNDYFSGTIEEVRFSKIARSKAWLKAEYYSGLDTLNTITIGSIYYVSGYVTEKDLPVQRTVFLYDRVSGELIDKCISNGQGYYELKTTTSGLHNVVCLDTTVAPDYDDLIMSKIVPVEAI